MLGSFFLIHLLMICFYFIVKCDICNFADKKLLYSCQGTLEKVIFHLEFDLAHVLNWFSTNRLAANPAKFQMLMLENKNLPVEINIGSLKLSSIDLVELLGAKIDSNLSL